MHPGGRRAGYTQQHASAFNRGKLACRSPCMPSQHMSAGMASGVARPATQPPNRPPSPRPGRARRRGWRTAECRRPVGYPSSYQAAGGWVHGCEGWSAWREAWGRHMLRKRWAVAIARVLLSGAPRYSPATSAPHPPRPPQPQAHLRQLVSLLIRHGLHILLLQ